MKALVGTPRPPNKPHENFKNATDSFYLISSLPILTDLQIEAILEIKFLLHVDIFNNDLIFVLFIPSFLCFISF